MIYDILLVLLACKSRDLKLRSRERGKRMYARDVLNFRSLI